LAQDGAIVGRGWTQPRGRPHAETEALRRAGAAARAATAYVTLEPCAHHGQTPPCTDALVGAGIARCVVAVADPDPRVAGAGIARLRQAGIEVAVGVLEAEARELLAGYLLQRTAGRPLVSLKLATSLDGRIATHDGESKWITSEPARARAQLMRARHDAVMIGVGTAAADDPELTCRLPGLARRSPVRVVLDGGLRLPLTSRLVRSARDIPLWLLAAEGADPLRERAYVDCGVEVLVVPRDHDGRPDLAAALAALGRRGITSVLVEGGGHVAAALLRAGLADRLAWFRAGRVLGGDGVPAVAPFGLRHLAEAPPWRRLGVETVGDDVLETFTRPL
jgi:diaminohydroxyphosphoribosylaminopyrimidine deaminase/5-amino-6-(5-phosphoribosylamino)uracil reductase